MAWVRLDDHFPEHPKVYAAGPLPAWLYVCSLAYANRNLTDGFIPAEAVPALTRVPSSKKLVDALLRVGLWERGEGGYRIHDYLSYQPSSNKVAQKREQTAARVTTWRRKSNAVTNEEVTALQAHNTPHGVTHDVTPPPDPTRSRTQPGPGDLLQTGPINGQGGAGGPSAATAAASQAPPPVDKSLVRASPKPDRVAAVVDLVRAAGATIVPSDRDGKAVKGCSAAPDEIARAYVAAFNGEWGDDWLRNNLALHIVIPRLAGYQASLNGKVNGRNTDRGTAGSVRHY